MSAQKFEKLIDLIINEDQAQAEQLFHDIIVEKSREIYESLINEDQSMGFQEEVEAEGEGMPGMMEADEEGFEDDEIIAGDFDTEDGEESFDDEEDFDAEEGEEEFGGAEGEGDLEDRVVDLEDKLDELMAEFEAQMGSDGEEEEFGAEEEFGSDDGEEEFGAAEEEVMENVTLKKVSVTHGDNGSQTKSPVTANSGQRGMASSPVKFANGTETMPTSPKKPSNYVAKGEGKLIGDVGNTPGKDNFKEKGEAAPKPKTETVKAKSPVAESRTAKRRI